MAKPRNPSLQEQFQSSQNHWVKLEEKKQKLNQKTGCYVCTGSSMVGGGKSYWEQPLFFSWQLLHDRLL